MADNIPWGVFFLVGGGTALSSVMQDSGLTDFIAYAMDSLESVPDAGVQAILCIMPAIFTQLTTSTAAVAVFAPIGA